MRDPAAACTPDDRRNGASRETRACRSRRCTRHVVRGPGSQPEGHRQRGRIAAEHLQRTFERFYRVDAARDRDHGGTGVGLAISRAIARAHGGELSAASAGRGVGTTFTLSLPMAERTSEKLHTAP
jgi:hypothetical protein